jgi:hypothetical protein
MHLGRRAPTTIHDCGVSGSCAERSSFESSPHVHLVPHVHEHEETCRDRNDLAANPAARARPGAVAVLADVRRAHVLRRPAAAASGLDALRVRLGHARSYILRSGGRRPPARGRPHEHGHAARDADDGGVARRATAPGQDVRPRPGRRGGKER